MAKGNEITGGMLFVAGLFGLAGVGAVHIVKKTYEAYNHQREMRCMEKLVLKRYSNVLENTKVEEPKQEEVSEEA